jgi:hypothetical protein
MTTDLKRLGTKETAARIRADIKNLQKHGALPAGKFSVTMDRFAGGSSIDIRVVDVDAVMFSAERFAAELRDPRAYHYDEPRMTAEGERIMDLLKKVVGVYHEDKSDIMSDYFNVNFYEHIGARDQEDKERAAFDAAMAEAEVARMDAEDEAECAAAIEERNAEIKAFAAKRAAALAALDAEVASTGILTLVTEALTGAASQPSLDAVVAALRALEDPAASADAKRSAVDVVDGVDADMLVDAYVAMAV